MIDLFLLLLAFLLFSITLCVYWTLIILLSVLAQTLIAQPVIAVAVLRVDPVLPQNKQRYLTPNNGLYQLLLFFVID
jgi:hypothetical protein